MTRTELIAGLDLLVEMISDERYPPQAKDRGLTPAEWGYVRGVGSSAILRMRDELAKFGPVPAGRQPDDSERQQR